jgi:hypothetical protein
MDLAVLKAELVNDPLGRGYAGMTDAAASGSLNNPDRQVDPETITPVTLLADMVRSEWQVLVADDKQYLSYLCSCASIDMRGASQARAEITAMFPAGSATHTNLLASMTNLVGRGVELGLGFVSPGDVGMARAS